MKKLTNFLMIFVLFSVILASCNKDENMINQKQTQDPTEQKILAFKAKVENPVKTDETFSVDSAVWYIEALLNYENCILSKEQAEINYTDKYIDSLSIEVTISEDNYVSVDDVLGIYTAVENKMYKMFNNIDNEVKIYRIVDIQYSENLFKAIIVLNFGNESQKSSKNITDSWYWAYNYGKCNGTGVGYDASDIITMEVDKTVSYLYSKFYTNVTYIEGNPRDPDSFDPTMNLMFWHNTEETYPDYHYCINSYDMNVYAYETAQFLDFMRNDWYFIPSNYTLISWRSTHDQYYNNDGYMVFQHVLRTYFGIPHVAPPNN